MARTSSPNSPQESPEGTPRSGPSSVPGAAEDSTLIFSCKCSNVTITGRLLNGSRTHESGESTTEELQLGKGAEKAKHAVYIGYDAPEPERKSRRASHSGDAEAAPAPAVPVWRVCWLCETKLYQVEGKRKSDAAVVEGVVMVDRNCGIVVSDHAEIPSHLPYSNLSLPIPRTSNFGRPPQETLTTVYPAPCSPSSRHTTHLPRFPDPFFLPPPFIPSHPHLRELCANAVDYLTACHSSSEIDVKNYIEIKAQEMRALEEKVRAEVELMWDKYVQGPGREDVRERERRRSESIGTSIDRKGKARDGSGRGGFGNGAPSGISASPSPSVDNPIMREAALATFPGGTSLLSASISQASYMPRPAPVTDQVDSTIDELARTYDKKGDQRAMAMSYVFSNLNGAMAGKSPLGKSTQEMDEEAKMGPELHGRDSWVDEERSEAWRRERRAVKAAVRDGGEDKTPKASAMAGTKTERRGSFLSEARKTKGKVSFEVPVSEGSEDQSSASASAGEDDDYVFDFELEDRPSAESDSTSHAKKAESAPISTQQRLEDTLSSTYASHAPSHRSAHRRLLAGEKDTYQPFRRRVDTSTGPDESTISKLATSVPMPIGFRGSLGSTPRAAPSIPYAFERKTSLSERHGMMVPPLMQAMRQRGVVESGNTRGSSSPLAGAATEVGDEDGAKGSSSGVPFNADPGPVMESLGDGEQEGTLRENKGFVPPHLLARKESLQSGDVGWRSMVSES